MLWSVPLHPSIHRRLSFSARTSLLVLGFQNPLGDQSGMVSRTALTRLESAPPISAIVRI